MTLERDFHMLGGNGDRSYAANSTAQKKIASAAISIVREALERLVSEISSSVKLLVFADLGCATGANTFLMFPEVVDTIAATCNELGRPVPEIQLLLNDLPGNDYNTLCGPILSSFKKLIKESSVPWYMAAVPGSFYERLFPERSVHFVYSSTSVHWLSQVPVGLKKATKGPNNKPSFWISKRSPPLVSKLYLEQFQKDFSSFLKHWSEELCSEGRMALILCGRTSTYPLAEENMTWISWYEEAFYELVSQGIVKASDVDSFHVPVYLPSVAEVKAIIQMEGSFEITQHDIYEVLYIDGVDVVSDGAEQNLTKLVKIYQAIIEPLLVSHFGDAIVDPLLSTVPKIFAKHFRKDQNKSAWIAISLKKK